MDEFKTDLWEIAGVPAPPGDQETNQTVIFGYLVAWFLGDVSSCIGFSRRAHPDIMMVLDV